MSRHRTARKTSSSAPNRYPRTARLGELLREVVAEELERIGDERLEHVAVTSVDVDQELNRAVVFFDAFEGEQADRAVASALADHRIRLQAAIGQQIRARKTPILDFRPDEVLRSAERIDRILRENPIPDRPVEQDELSDGDPDAGDDAADDDAADDETTDDRTDPHGAA